MERFINIVYQLCIMNKIKKKVKEPIIKIELINPCVMCYEEEARFFDIKTNERLCQDCASVDSSIYHSKGINPQGKIFVVQ